MRHRCGMVMSSADRYVYILYVGKKTGCLAYLRPKKHISADRKLCCWEKTSSMCLILADVVFVERYRRLFVPSYVTPTHNRGWWGLIARCVCTVRHGLLALQSVSATWAHRVWVPWNSCFQISKLIIYKYRIKARDLNKA